MIKDVIIDVPENIIVNVVASKRGFRYIYRRITQSDMPFALHLHHFVGQRRYAPLIPAKGPSIFPASFPHNLARKPDRAGEASVYKALAASMPAGTQVFYDRSVKGARRRVDFLVLIPDRGLIAIEVKGGLVHSGRGACRQATHSLQGQRAHRKRIEPFKQVKLALGQLWEKSGINPLAVPTFIMAAFPKMSEDAFPWRTATHILTREDFEDQKRLEQRLTDALPKQNEPIAALDRLSAALIANMPRPRKKP